MKTTTLLFTFLACAFFSNAQVNTLPTSGKVGIGTTNPHEALEVRGNMAVDSSMVVRDTLIVEDDARIMHDMRVEGATEMQDVIIYGTTWMKGLQDVNASDFGILVAKEDGTVMRTTPGGLFPVPNQPVGFCDLQGNTYSTNPYWVSQPQKLYTACPDVFVGVGTEIPRVKLDVLGTTYSQRIALSADPLTMGGARLSIQGYAPQDATNLINVSNTSSDLFQLSNQGLLNLNGRIVINSNDQEPLVISNSTEKILQLNDDGTLRTRAIKVNVFQWPDYVFEPSYNLADLQQVEEYIQENGHLPNVPSAEQLSEEGLDLYEMNKILMEKVEELTLYIIEQNKKIEKLEEKLQ
ncbi:MAG: hypothetical protein NXI10_03645 [bacterium]|nr:hypothetical protein [bacterium]